MDIKTKDFTRVVVIRHESRPSRLPIVVRPREQRADPFGPSVVKLVPNNMGVCFDHADSFEIDHFDQYFHLILWLKVTDDTVFEVIVLEYDRYESPLGARSRHKYLVL